MKYLLKELKKAYRNLGMKYHQIKIIPKKALENSLKLQKINKKTFLNCIYI